VLLFVGKHRKERMYDLWPSRFVLYFKGISLRVILP